MIARRSFITGLVSFVAAPAIVRAESLMRIKPERIEGRGLYDHYGVGPAMQAMRSDLMAFGTGVVFVSSDGRPSHIAHQSRVTFDDAMEQGWFG